MQLFLDHFKSILDLDLQVLTCFNQWVMDERVEELQDIALVLAKNTKDDFTALLEDSLFLEDAKSVHYVGSEAEWDDFGNLQLRSLLEDAVKVNVSHFARVLMNQDVVSVTITKADDVAND